MAIRIWHVSQGCFKVSTQTGAAMPGAEGWLIEYGESHRDMSNPGVYWLSVPLLVLATVGLLWSLPIPQEFARISPILNWATVFLMAAVVYYFIISLALAIGMLPFVFGLIALQIWLVQSSFSHTHVALGLFIASIAGLYLGHRPGGGIKAVFGDIQLMMIAPIWLLAQIYRRIGIPY